LFNIVDPPEVSYAARVAALTAEQAAKIAESVDADEPKSPPCEPTSPPTEEEAPPPEEPTNTSPLNNEEGERNLIRVTAICSSCSGVSKCGRRFCSLRFALIFLDNQWLEQFLSEFIGILKSEQNFRPHCSLLKIPKNSEKNCSTAFLTRAFD
jgi:hypothetical protein